MTNTNLDIGVENANNASLLRRTLETVARHPLGSAAVAGVASSVSGLDAQTSLSISAAAVIAIKSLTYLYNSRTGDSLDLMTARALTRSATIADDMNDKIADTHSAKLYEQLHLVHAGQ